MDISEAKEFLRQNRRAIFCTRRRDGSPQLSPVVCAVDATGTVIVSTSETSAKARNLVRDPRVSVCAITEGFFGAWIQVDGTVEIVHLPEAMEGLVEYYRLIGGEHRDWDDYQRAMVAEKRVLLKIEIERVVGADPVPPGRR